VLNGTLDNMESAIMRLRNRLSASNDSYGFFFYAGHGVQSNGENFLLPVDANIPSESFLRTRSVSVQIVLDELNNAGNFLNIVVLDACRDNPISRWRGGGRGLAVVANQPADSIIVFATSAGSVADDGSGRNGFFTEHLLNNLRIPGREVHEVFISTGADVAEASRRRQVPAIYNQFFGRAYLGPRPVVRPPVVFEAGPENIATGTLEILTITAGVVEITGTDLNQTMTISAWGSIPIEKINSGNYRVIMRYEDGRVEEKNIEVGRTEEVKLEFSYRPVPPREPSPPSEPREPRPPREPREREPRDIDPAATRLNTIGASVGSSFSAPWFIGSVHGTVAPSNYSFFKFGMDAGFGSGDADVGHFSLYPFAHYAFFLPFKAGGGWHAGAGAGFMYTSYSFPGADTISDTYFAADLSTGFIFKSGITVYYTLRTNFNDFNNKFAVGYAFRFR